MPQPPPATHDPLADVDDAFPGAVLLSDQIEFYSRELPVPLISHPDEARSPIEQEDFDLCIDAASYKLRLGGEADIGGKWGVVDEKHPLVLDPHQVAVVVTFESINLPRFLIGRWNLRVQWVYEGLLWVGGPQVDPGWTGQLYCPIYNLAERQVVIPYKERVFTIDFTRTSPFHARRASYGYSSKPHEPNRRKSLQDHDKNRIHSAPFERLREIQALTEFRTLAIQLISVLFVVLAAVVAALSIVIARPLVDPARPFLSPWPLAALGLALFAAVLSLSSGVRNVASLYKKVFRRGG
jgi:deoxycytidine triphosphate deaminase